jgi:PAS domain S-box-containing protein
MYSEPDIVRVLRQEEKNGKLGSKFSIESESLMRFDSLDIDTSKNDPKMFSNLMEIINFTEKVSTSLHGNLNREEIIEIVINEFKKSEKYTGSILLLSDDNKKLEIAGTSSESKNIKNAEKISGFKIKSYKISLGKSKIYSQVIYDGKTVDFKIIELLEEILPKKLAYIVKKTIKIDKNIHVATPLIVNGKIIGAFAMSSTMLHDYFIPSVKNLALHISYSFEHAINILNQKETQKIISKSEQIYRPMVEKAPLGIFSVDTKGIVTSCNDAFIKMAGYQRDELIGKNVVNFPTLMKKDIPKYLKMFKSIISGNVPKSFIFNWKHKSGKICTGELFISLIRIDNKITGIQAIIKDLSETQEAQLKLKDAEERYNSLFEGSMDLVYICNFKGKFIDANKAALNLLGYDNEDIKTLNLKSLLDSTQQLKAVNVIREIKKLGHQKSVREFKLKRKNGEHIYVESIGSLLYRDGKPYAVQGIARDITERKMAEFKIKNRSEDLELINLVNKAINTNQNLDKILTIISTESGKIFNSYNATIYLVSDDKQFLIMKKPGLDSKNKKMVQKLSGIDLSNFKISLNIDNIYSRTIQDRKSKLLNNQNEILGMVRDSVDNKILKKFAPLILKKLNIKSTMLIPLITDKECFGLIDISRDKYFNESDMIRFDNIAKQLTIAIDKKILKESKRESEEKYRDLYDRLRDASVKVNMSRKITECNSIFLDMLGYLPDELLKLSYEDITPKKWHKIEDKIIKEQVLKQGYSELYEKEYIKKDGTIMPIEITTYLIKDKDDNPTGMWALIRDISERKEYEKELKESREYFKTLFNTIIDPVAIVDKKGKILEITDKVVEITGYARDEFIGKNFMFTKFASKKTKLALLEKLIKRMAGVKIPPYEIEIIRKNGDKVTVEINAAKIDYFGKVAEMVVFRDVSERKLAEKSIKESEEKFRNLAEESPNMIFINQKCKVVYANKKCEETMGYKREEFYKPDFNFLKLIAPEYRKIINENQKKHESGKELFPYEYELITKDGNRIESIITTKLIKYSGENAILGIITDITEWKKAEQRLKESEENYRNMVELAPDGIITISTKGVINSCNPAFSNLMGFSKDEIIGKHISNLPTMRKRDIPKYLKLFYSLLRGKKQRSFEFEWVHKDGTQHLAEVRAGLLKKNDKIIGLQAILRDITEQKKAEQELHIAHEELKALNQDLEKKVEGRTAEINRLLKQKDEFINQLGHDLKNPLSPITNLLPLIKEKVSDDKTQDQLNIIIRNVDFMKNLVVKTIELAKLNSPYTEFFLEDTNLSDEINNIIEKNKTILQNYNINIVKNLDEDTFINTDRLRLNELFDNIITNAVKFSPNGGNITFNTEDEGEFIKISVKDFGIGLSEKQKNHIFDEFYKVDKSRHDFESSGLGLTICKRIVEKQGGRIWVESQGHLKGTTINFTLPKANKK